MWYNVINCRIYIFRERGGRVKKSGRKKWIKFRHNIVRNLLYCILYPYSRLKYGIEIERFKEQEKRPYLILLNHQTPFDQFFAGMAFKGHVYYLATEDIFSKGWISSVIRWLVAPIPIKKQTTDVGAVMNCMRVAREGGTVCIAPEGNRTYSGKTEYMNPAIAPLARKLGLPVVLFRIEGGYGAQPRWSDGVRRGKMRAYVSEVISPERVAEMSNDELLAAIEKGLYVNEAVADGIFESERRAEYLERAVFWCPECGFSKFESHGNVIECTGCERRISYGKDKRLQGIGFDFPFEFVNEWYERQKAEINKLDLDEYIDTPFFEDTADVSEVFVNRRKEKYKTAAKIKLFGNRITVDEQVFPFDEVTAIAVLGRNKLNVYHGGRVYQFKGDKRFNALKYVFTYYRRKNIAKGEESGEFLGL